MNFSFASICGNAKCGTTWLLHALSIHPEILGIGECDFFGNILNKPEKINEALFTRSPWYNPNLPLKVGSIEKPHRHHFLSEDQINRLHQVVNSQGEKSDILYRFFSIIHEWKPSAKLVLTKAAHQIHLVEKINSCFPECRLIFIARDGRDAAISYQNFDKVKGKEPKPIEHYAQLWSAAMQKYLEVRNKVEICFLSYEDLTSDFDSNIKRILSFLDIKSDSSIIQAMKQGSSFENFSGRPRGDEDKNSIFRKGALGDWRHQFTEEDKDIFKQVAGPTLIAMGYEKDLNW